MPSTESHATRAYRWGVPGVTQLDRETERELARRWRAGDRRAGDRLITACLPFVVSIALEYRRWGVPLEDVVQQGTLGLLRAAAKFDTARECRLATYAAYWVRAEIRDYVIRTYRVVRLGTTKAERRAVRSYRKTREESAAGLAAVSGMTPEKAAWLLPLLAARESSLDAHGEEHGALGDRLAGAGPSPEDAASAGEHRRASAGGRDRGALRDPHPSASSGIVRARLMTGTRRGRSRSSGPSSG